MEAKRTYTLIALGLCIRSLYNGFPTDASRIPKKHIRMLRNGLADAGFDVSVAGLRSISIIEDALAELPNTAPIGASIAEDLSAFMLSFEKIVHAEASTKRVYVIPKRRFNQDFLLETPDKLLKDGLFFRLSTIAQSDLASACRCLAFGEATASAFHVLRSTEDTLKRYYLCKIKKNRISKPMWGNMVAALRAKRTGRPSTTLLDSLDLIRSSYRNPTQHPESMYDVESAQDLLGVCLDLIGKMAADLPDSRINLVRST